MNDLIKDNPINSLYRIFLWLNSGCNSRCKMCDIWKDKTRKETSVAEVVRWIEDWKELSIQKIVICGEPLLHSQIWAICDVIKGHGLRIELLTNGYLLHHHAQNVVRYCDVVRVSLDGPQAIHNQSRGIPAAFHNVKRGVRSLREVNPTFQVDGRCAVHRLNFRHLRATVDAAHDIGLNSISFSGTDVYNEEAFKRYDHINEHYVDDLLIHLDELPELEKELTSLKAEYAEDFRTGFISDTPASLDRILVAYYYALAGQNPFPTIVCNAPWTSAIIEYNGLVRPCFPMPPLGTVRVEGLPNDDFAQNATLKNVLNSPTAISFREKLDVENNLVCQRCVCSTAIYR